MRAEADIDFWGVKRPHLDSFIRFAERYFEKIIVWSAGTKDYVSKIVDFIFRDHDQPYAILNRDDVVYIDGTDDYHKPISEIERNYPGLISNRDLTVFVDDKLDNGRNNIGNFINIPAFRPSISKGFTSDDRCLLDLMNWLMTKEVLDATNIGKLDKTNIFSTEVLDCVFSTNDSKFDHHHMTTPQHKFLYAPYT